MGECSSGAQPAGRKRRAGSTAPCFGCASRDHPGAVIAASGIASVLDGDLETSFSFSFPSFPRHGTSSVPGWCFLLRYFYFQAPLRVAPPPFSKLKEAFSCQELGIWLRGVFMGQNCPDLPRPVGRGDSGSAHDVQQ